MGMLFDDHLYISTFISGAVYIFKILEIQFNMCQLPKSACVIFFLSVHIIWEFTRYGLQEKTELLILSFYFMLIGNGKVLRLYSDTHAALPPLAPAVNSYFPDFLRSERRKTGNCRFTAVLTGGKMGFPDFLHSERRKAGSCSFTAALIGGKVDFPFFLHSERRKTGNCSNIAGTYGGNLSIQFFYHFFPSFACWGVVGRGLVPQSEGWVCVNSNWVK